MSGKVAALRAFVVKEIHHILRDRQTLTILLLMPLVQVVLFGFALRSDVKDVRIAIVDPAPDHATLAIRNRFGATSRFRVVASSRSTDGPLRLCSRQRPGRPAGTGPRRR